MLGLTNIWVKGKLAPNNPIPPAGGAGGKHCSCNVLDEGCRVVKILGETVWEIVLETLFKLVEEECLVLLGDGHDLGPPAGDVTPVLCSGLAKQAVEALQGEGFGCILEGER